MALVAESQQELPLLEVAVVDADLTMVEEHVSGSVDHRHPENLDEDIAKVFQIGRHLSGKYPPSAPH